MTGRFLTQAEFERVVDEAIESLPKRFADLVENVVIAVEEEPTAEDLESLDDDDEGDGDVGAPGHLPRRCAHRAIARHAFDAGRDRRLPRPDQSRCELAG